MFEYVKEEQANKILEKCNPIFERVKEASQKMFNVEFSLLGVNEKSFLTVDYIEKTYEAFYIIIIQDNLQKLFMDYPSYASNIFVKLFNRIAPENNFTFILGKSLLECKMKFEDDMNINLDVAIMSRNPNGTLSKLFRHEKTPSYIWWCISETKDFNLRYEQLKNEGHYTDLRDCYIIKKNQMLNNDNYCHTNFFLFLKSINEVWNRYYAKV